MERDIHSFLAVLASKAPTPGGGGAAALCAAAGIALGNMVGNLTLGKKKYAEVEEGGRADFKCAGMSDALKSIMRFDDFKVGFFTPACTHCGGNCQRCYANTAFWGLRPKNVPGGVVLVPSPFSIK